MAVRIALTLALVALAWASGAQAPYAPPPPSEPSPSPPRPGRGAAPPPAEPPTTWAPAAATTTTTAETAPENATTTAIDAATETPTATATPIEPPTPAPEPASPPTPDPSSASTALRGYEWGLGVVAREGAGMGEASALADFGRFALGGMISVGGAGEETGAGLHLVGGPRFRVSDAVRVDLLADLGLTFYGDDGESSSFVDSTKKSGSEQVLPTAGARAGVTFTSPTSGWYLTLGAGIRHVQTVTVTYTETTCPILSACTTRTKEARYGGTVAGGVLTFGRAYPRRR